MLWNPIWYSNLAALAVFISFARNIPISSQDATLLSFSVRNTIVWLFVTSFVYKCLISDPLLAHKTGQTFLIKQMKCVKLHYLGIGQIIDVLKVGQT